MRLVYTSLEMQVFGGYQLLMFEPTVGKSP